LIELRTPVRLYWEEVEVCSSYELEKGWEMDTAKPDKHEIAYFVNGEEETTEEHELTVRQILENAGFKPAEDYALKSENPKEDFDSEYDREVKIHPNQRFDALFKGPTPTS
jgi:hypothetical protein